MLLIVHGLGRTATEWADWAREGAVVPDLPELRRTDAPPDVGAVVVRLVAELDARGIDRAVWLGHSGGGHVAIEAAGRFPDRVAAVIVVAAAPSRRHLDQVRCPVLLVIGERDPLAIPGVRAEVIAGAGHDPHLDAPAELREVVARWLREVA